MVILRIFLIMCLDGVNVSGSHYIKSQNNGEVTIEPIGEHLYTILDHKKNKDENRILKIKSDTHQEASLLIDELTFLHTIYINNEIASQNIDERAPFYNNDYAYKVLQIDKNDYIKGTVKIEIIGSGVNKTNAYLGKEEIVKDSSEIRTMIHVVLLVFLMISTLLSMVLYVYNKKDSYFLIFSMMGIVSIVKAIS